MEQKIKLDSVLLPVLLIPFIMTYGLGVGVTPYGLFGLIFLGLLLYLILDLVNIGELKYNRLKKIILWFLILASIGSASVSAIIVRHQTAPVYGVHDIILQLEAAIRFFLQGQNPYSVTYFGTPLEVWHYSSTEINPALYHFVMPPFYLLFSTLFYFLSITFLGFFDGRMPLVFLFLGLLIMASRLIKDQEKKRLFLILLAFNPATLGYYLEGRDDIFMLFFLFAGLYLLRKSKYFLAGILMALAFATKQSVWPIFPFYFAYLWFGKNVIKSLLPFAVTFGLLVLPFFFWDQKAYLNSTILYLSGNTVHSYPIAGYGLGSLLMQMGWIKDKFAYYPFWIWQAIICGPLAAILIWWQKKENTVQRLILSYVIFLSVFWYLSRYFNNSHLGYLSMIFVMAYFWPEDQFNQ